MAEAVKIPRIFHVTNNGNKKWGWRYDGVMYEMEPGQTIRVTHEIAEHLLAHSLQHPASKRVDSNGLTVDPVSFLSLEEQDIVLGPVQKLQDKDGTVHKTLADLIKGVEERVKATFERKKDEPAPPEPVNVPGGGEETDADLKRMGFSDLKALAVAANVPVVGKTRAAIEAAVDAKRKG